MHEKTVIPSCAQAGSLGFFRAFLTPLPFIFDQEEKDIGSTCFLCSTFAFGRK